MRKWEDLFLDDPVMEGLEKNFWEKNCFSFLSNSAVKLPTLYTQIKVAILEKEITHNLTDYT